MLLRESNKEDFKVFVPSQWDLAEAQAMGITPSFPNEAECITLEHNGEVLAIGGNVEGQCWFVTSHLAVTLSGDQRKEFRGFIERHRDNLLTQYPVLWNYVWVGNFPHRTFLETIGAVFHDEFSDESKQFQLFTIGG